jgi:hypothetical protein
MASAAAADDRPGRPDEPIATIRNRTPCTIPRAPRMAGRPRSGGHWVLETDGGERYQLTGSLGGCKDGQTVEVEGKVDKTAMGIGMTGPSLTVQKITAR